MKENKLVDLSMDFAVEVLETFDTVKGHHSLVNQIERSATSIGANIREANYGHGRADFVAKLQIALKECYETEYWLPPLIPPKTICDFSTPCKGSFSFIIIDKTPKTMLQ